VVIFRGMGGRRYGADGQNGLGRGNVKTKKLKKGRIPSQRQIFSEATDAWSFKMRLGSLSGRDVMGVKVCIGALAWGGEGQIADGLIRGEVR